MLGRFWRQENKPYRNMQIVLTLLTLNFVIPSCSYFFAPHVAIEQFKAIGRLMGAPDYPLAEESLVWRVLAAGNVFTLGFLCFLLQLDVRRFANVRPVFYVLKSYSSLGYLYVFLFVMRYPVFLGIFFFDGLAVFLVWFFCGRALRSIEATKIASDRLVPRPVFSSRG